MSHTPGPWKVHGKDRDGVEGIIGAYCESSGGFPVVADVPPRPFGQPAGTLRAEPVPVSGKAAHQAQVRGR